MVGMTFGSLFSGAGLMDLGIERAGLSCRFQCEINEDARRVLAHHWPGVPCHEDVRGVGKHNLEPVDLIVFGSPCQDFSVAGKRAGITGERSGLFHEAIRVLHELRPAFALWEGVPGTLSSHSGRDFASILCAFRECGARDICWRVLDARYFGVAQRRRRVFLVADFRGERAAEILFERPCGCGDSPTREETRADVAGTLRGRSANAGVNRPGQGGEDDENLIAFEQNQRNEVRDLGNQTSSVKAQPGMKNQTFLAFQNTGRGYWSERDEASTIGTEARGVHETNLIAGTLNFGNAKGGFRTEPGEHLIAFKEHQSGVRESHYHATIDANKGSRRQEGIRHGMMVRRLTPTECLRLMGAPDAWLDLDPPLSDSAKYRLCGNGCVVSVCKWIGCRIRKAFKGVKR